MFTASTAVKQSNSKPNIDTGRESYSWHSLPPMTLTVVGADGNQVTLNQTSMAALTSYTANGGFKSSGRLIADVGTYTGVPVYLLNLVGGITISTNIDGNRFRRLLRWCTPTTKSKATVSQPLRPHNRQ